MINLMPFNINPPCEKNKKTIIIWQFPGQSEKFNDQGDDYEISLSFYDCPWDVNLNIAYNINVKYSSQGLPGFAHENWLEPNYGAISLQRVVEIPDINNLLNPIYDIYQFVRRFEKDYLRKLGRVGDTIVSATGVSTVSRNSDYFDLSTLRNVRIIPNDENIFNNCKKYTINIYKSGEKIFSDEGSDLPIVTWECEELQECPENTCPVDCGDHICCYNDEGIAVYSYLKPFF